MKKILFVCITIGLMFATLINCNKDNLSDNNNSSNEYEIHIEEVPDRNNIVLTNSNSLVNENNKDINTMYNINDNKSNKDAIKKESIKLPEMLLVQPVRREGSYESKPNIYPCGGVTKGKANALTNLGSKIDTIWEVRYPVANGNCTVSLSPALEENFIKLKPYINSYSLNTNDNNNNNMLTNNDYTFNCGRQLGFEFMEFELPTDYSCDHCTLQIEWNTPRGVIYSCSDFMIIGNKMENCLAKCKNGGSCVNGKCICTKNYTGEFCEINLNASSNIGWIILLLLVISAVTIGIYLVLNKRKEDNWGMKKDDEAKIDKQFKENNKKEDLIIRNDSK